MLNRKALQKNDPVLNLCNYWLRASYMHELAEFLRQEIGISELGGHGAEIEFMTYLEFWLSALFVTAEGYRRLRLKDARLDSLIREHVSELKAVRDSIYHYDHEFGRKGTAFFEGNGINWALELHEAFKPILRG